MIAASTDSPDGAIGASAPAHAGTTTRCQRVLASIADFSFCWYCSPDHPQGRFRLEGRFEQILGIDRAGLDALGGWGALIAPEDRSMFEKAILDLPAGGQAQLELRIRTPGGELRWLRIAACGLEDPGDSRRVVRCGACFDVTRQREIAEAFAATEQLLVASIDAMPDWVHITDERGRIVYLNHAMRKLWRRVNPRSPAIGRPLGEVFTFLPADTGERLRIAIAGDKPVTATATYDIGGESVSVSTRRVPVRLPGGAVRLVSVARDVTAAIALQEEAQRAREQWERTFDAIPDLVAILGLDHRIMRMNRAMADRLGPLAADCIGVPCSRFFHVPPEPPANCPHEMMLADGLEHTVEQHLAGVGGDFLITASPMRDDQGRLVGSVHVARDITERKLADVALKESHERYRLLFEQMLDGFALHEIITDSAGVPTDYRFLEVNPAFERITGLKAADLIGRTVLEVMPGTERFWIDTYGRVAQGGGSISFEHFSAELDQFFAVSAFMPRPGQFAVMVGNITDRKLVEHALEESEEKFRALVENLTDVVFRLDRDLQILYVSPAIVTLPGVTPERLIGCRLPDAPLPEPINGLLADGVRQAVSSRRVVERRIELASPGEPRVFDVRLFPETDADGATVTVLGIARDITAQVASEQALARSEESLRALTTSLEQIRESEKVRIAGQLHDDIGQVLTSLKIEIDRVRRWVERGGAVASKERVGQRLRELVGRTDECLAAARRLAFELRPSMLEDLGLAASIEQQASRFTERSRIPCETRIRLRADRLLPAVSLAVYRVLQESLTNVMRHARARRVMVGLFRKAGRVVLTVDDNGIGIPPDCVESVRSLGVLRMRERARAVGGILTIGRRPGGGTRVRLEVGEQNDDQNG